MNLIKQQIDDLLKIDAPLTRKADFGEFWAQAIAKVDAHDIKLETKLSDYPLGNIKVYDSSFRGLDDTPVRCWVMLPETKAKTPCPVIVHFHGGSGHRGNPTDFLHWLVNGYAVVSMDFRQQGGLTGSNTPMMRCGADSFAVMNLLDYRSYYLYHAWTDALICLRVAEQVEELDENTIVVSGSSQGGGTSLAMASLRPNLISACLASVPSYCWWERRIFIRSACAADIARFIQRNPQYEETVFNTMSYYDVINFVDRITCPVVISCGMKDDKTPPDCVYAAYNKIRSEKTIHNYSCGGHTLEPRELENWLRFLKTRL
jgi:cephalosporin-C deacetylase